MQKLLASILHLNAQLEAELSAAKVDDLVAANPRLEAEIRSLNDKDPSKTKKYLSWGVKQLLRGEKVDDVASAIKDYNANVAKLEVKDINKYATLSSLKDDLAKLAPSKKETAKQAKGNVKTLLESDRWLLVRPLTVEASCFYGKGTKWCISGRMADRYYNDYSSSNTFFYFLIDKQAEAKSQFGKLAIALIKNKPLFVAFFDARDNSLDEEVAKKYIAEIFTPTSPNFSPMRSGTRYSDIMAMCRADCDNQPDTWQFQLLQSSAAHGRGSEVERIFFEHYPFEGDTILSLLAGRQSTPPAVLEELAKHRHDFVRAGVARNPNTPTSVLLETLQKDPVGQVRMFAFMSLTERNYQALEK